MSKEGRNRLQVAPLTPVILVSLGAAVAMLALFQWMELLIIRSGGHSVCSINETLNCEQVWNSAFASRIHELLGIPVAALGVVWGAAAFGVSLQLVYRLIGGSPSSVAIAAVRLTAAVGVLACVSFAVASLRASAVCITCLGTFALVLLFALAAAKLLPGPLTASREEIFPALAWSGGLALVAYLVVLGPGMKTPKATVAAIPAFEKTTATQQTTATRQTTATEDESVTRLRDFLLKLPKEEQQAISDALWVYQRTPAPEGEKFGVRNRQGPANAPVKIVEFTDIRCPHCAQLIQVMKGIERVVPEGRLAIEARNFPLDASCNPSMRMADEKGVRCLGAKVLICLERASDFWSLREKLFEEQESLTPERMLQIASSGSISRQKLEACIASPETDKQLKEDIQFAMRYSPQGTPLIILNGREAPFLPSFLFAMVMTGANPQSPAFAGLPSPQVGRP